MRLNIMKIYAYLVYMLIVRKMSILYNRVFAKLSLVYMYEYKKNK